MLRAFQTSSLSHGPGSIFNLVPTMDEEEQLMERYLKDNFDPVEALEGMLSSGQLNKIEERELLISTELPSTRLN